MAAAMYMFIILAFLGDSVLGQVLHGAILLGRGHSMPPFRFITRFEVMSVPDYGRLFEMPQLV
jgi:hypothetical protein